ncbi:sensor histidine kinase [Nonomuraea sp. SYSU D8015]|uniref:sensor histidine kinase n=1 Tax=Nonomuraea sp. SYSU D8015 TaxID=2593644 RepID=UPI001CB75C03|nr:histidine kinase [Nonomuraea sp. SYSU D8015]
MSDPTIVDVARRRLRALPHLWVDGVLAGVITVVQLWPLISAQSYTGQPWHWWGYVVAIGASVPLVWRRRAPVTVLVISLGTSALYDLAEPLANQPIWYGVLVAFYTVAAYSSPGYRMAMLIVALVGALLTVGSWETALRGVVQIVAAYAIGRAAATSRAHAAALEERAARLERERRMEAERAAERERARIARDMHDILAHAVSLMVVQAEAGPVVVRSDPARAEAAFDAIAAAGRDAMVQLRRLLGVLKEDEHAPRVPQPTIAELPALAGQVGGTGLDVAFAESGEPRPLAPDSAVAAYRITQEALTNIVKHSGADRADIRLTWEDDNLMIDITDNGPGAGRELPSGGNGLIGIRERAAACGGTATAGPRPDGAGFVVSVRLPLAAS